MVVVVGVSKSSLTMLVLPGTLAVALTLLTTPPASTAC